MRKTFILFAMALFLVFACEQDEPPLSTVNTVSDVTANAEYTTCFVTCSNESVDGKNVKIRLLLSEEESLKEYSVHEMGVTESANLKCELQELEQGKKYYFGFELYTKNDSYRIETVYDFETKSSFAPSVSTDSVYSITSTTAVCSGNVISEGSSAVTARGVCWGYSINPNISGQHLQSGTGVGRFSVALSPLDAGTTYYVRAYATNQAGTSYGENITFTTMSMAPIVITGNVSNITANSATGTGNVTSDGGSAITARGLCWSTSLNPAITGAHSTEPGTIGSFASQITGLSLGTTYFVRAYATNQNGIAYGENITFTTTATLPTVTTSAVSNITSNSADCGGNVTSDGGATITARGLCWSTLPNPTIANSHSTVYGTMGPFSCTITNLSPSTTYYVRAYATNSAGTSYGEEQSFITTTGIPAGAIPGLFSISATQQVYFSQGNLQYHSTTGQWRFATNQYDAIAEGNSCILSSSGCWIDLFGWGTGNNPTNLSTDATDYSSFVDWGTNAIENGGNQGGLWRTLSIDEWAYLLTLRPDASLKRGPATVDGEGGIVILPDSWDMPSNCSFNPSGVGFTSNIYTASQWAQMQSAGAVFLPSGGMRRYNTDNNIWTIIVVNTFGGYWSSTPQSGDMANLFAFTDRIGFMDYSYYALNEMLCGYSIRLVHVQ